MEKRCGLCGSTFTCQSAAGCWCNAVSLMAAQLARLAQAADNCVCAACLNAIAEGRAPSAEDVPPHD